MTKDTNPYNFSEFKTENFISDYMKLFLSLHLFAIIIFFLTNFIIAIFNLPFLYPEGFIDEINRNWQIDSIYNNFLFIIGIRIKIFTMYFTISFIIGLFGIIFLDFLVLFISFGTILVVGLFESFGFGFIIGLIWSFLNIIIVFSLNYTLNILSYIYQLIKFRFIKITLEVNPYYFIDTKLPFYGLRKQLSKDAFKEPILAKKFINFLFITHHAKRELAFYLNNIVDASYIFNNPLDRDIAIPKNYEKHQPTKSVIDNLIRYKDELSLYDTENNLHYKKESLEHIIEILKDLENDMIKDRRGWSEYYLKAIDKNMEVAYSELETLKQDSEKTQPMEKNIYRIGEALSPNDKIPVFKGRVDLIDDLSRVVRTAVSMPLLFMQGQRRVGKTSLINYLEVLLGSGFKIIKIDMQQAMNKKFKNLIENLNTQINNKINRDEIISINNNDNVNDIWIKLEAYLNKYTEKLKYRLIISFDEYESFHYNIATKYPEVLGYMRGFLQNQDRVIFLFAGLRDISELTKPNWDEFFPQIQKFKVDYLCQKDSIELITKPIESFRLIYPESIVDEIYQMTQGHPQLLQTICSLLVDSANENKTKDITKEMLDIGKEKIFDTNDRPMSIFYREYCDDRQREILEEILAQNPITQETREQRRALMRLIEYGFITKEHTIRVPLFEKWLIEKRESIVIEKI